MNPLSIASEFPQFVEVTPLGLIFKADAAPSCEEWESMGTPLLRVGRSFGFIIGDWLNYGAKQNWGEKYDAAMAKTGIDYGTLRNWAYTARKVPLSLRNDKLSWSHHNRVAALPEKEQSRWLDKIEGALDKGDCVSVKRLAKSIEAGKLLTEADCQTDIVRNGIENHIPWINRLVKWYREKKEARWFDECTPEQKQAVCDDLKRIVDIYDEIAAPDA